MIRHVSGRKIGLARFLSKLGYCSRSHATELIRAGRVLLNGNFVRDPETPVRSDQERITVDGNPVAAGKKIYLMMNKPRGVVTTASDEKGRDTVYTILNRGKNESGENENAPWIAPVGRLDKASEGLLLLTNDSEWAARVIAPEIHLDKTYHVQIAAHPNSEIIKSLLHGVKAENGDVLSAKRASALRSGEKNSWLEIVLDEGKNRQIRRMLAALDIKVLRLIRIAVGPLQLGDLAKGTFRALSKNEKQSLDRAMSRRSA